MSGNPLFTLADGCSARVLVASDVPALQTFFETNPEFFLTVGGEPPGAHEAQNEFDDLPPAGMTFTGRYVIGCPDAAASRWASARTTCT